MALRIDDTLEEELHRTASRPLRRGVALLIALLVAAAFYGYLEWFHGPAR